MARERKVDPIVVAVLDNRFMAIAEEMGRTLERTSRSPIFAEARDFVTAIFTKDLRLIVQVEYIPLLAGAIPIAMEYIAKAYEGDINEGDIFIHNDCYAGNNHLPDVNIAKPIFYKGELMFWSVTKGHQADVGGGGVVGYNPRATTIWEDGLTIPACKLYDRGKLNRGVWELILKNIRVADIVAGDLMCMVGGATVGERNLLALLDRYGPETLYAAIDEIIAATERETRDKIRQIPDGVYYGEKSLDHDGIVRDKPVTVRAKVIKQGDEITIDLSDSDPQTIGFVNSTWANTFSIGHLAIYDALPGVVRRNHGSITPIKIIARKGTCVNPEFPAAVTLCTICPSDVIMGAISLALSDAIPQWIEYGHAPLFCLALRGLNPRTNRPYVCIDFLMRCQPSPGTEGYDGWPLGGPSFELGQGKFPDIEVYELVYPMVILQHEQQMDTAGAGKFRGGFGHQYRVKYLDDCDNIIVQGHAIREEFVPKGLFGGKSSRVNKAILCHTDGTVDEIDILIFTKHRVGDIMEVDFSGGAGFGDPFRRDSERVREDVSNELVSIEKAKEEYGVVIDPATLQINEEATEEVRRA